MKKPKLVPTVRAAKPFFPAIRQIVKTNIQPVSRKDSTTMITRSESIERQIAKTYGTMAAGQLQSQRKQFYSYVQYPLAGSSQLNFFGQAIGNNGVTVEQTNMPVQGSFGTSSFIIKGISLKYKILDQNLAAYNGLDTNTFATEILGGLFNAGVAELTVNAKSYLQVTKPFHQLPPADGRIRTYSAGQVSVSVDVEPDVTLSSRSENKYICDPEIFIAAQQNFAFSISYPSGLVPVRATNIITSSNILYVGVVLDGIELRPVQ